VESKAPEVAIAVAIKDLSDRALATYGRTLVRMSHRPDVKGDALLEETNEVLLELRKRRGEK